MEGSWGRLTEDFLAENERETSGEEAEDRVRTGREVIGLLGFPVH